MKKFIGAMMLVAGATLVVSCGQKDKAAELVQQAQNMAAAASDSSSNAVNIEALSKLPLGEKLDAYKKYGEEFTGIVKELKSGNTSVLTDYQKHLTTLQELGTQLQKDAAAFTPEQKKQFEDVLKKVTEAMSAQK